MNASPLLFSLLRKATGSPNFQELLTKITAGNGVIFEQIPPGGKAFALAYLLDALSSTQTPKSILWVLSDLTSRQNALENLSAFLPSKQIIDLPAWETLPGEEIEPSPELVGERFEALTKLQKQRSQPLVVIASLQALLQKVPSPNALNSFEIHKGKSLSHKKVQNLLVELGYEKVTLATDKGQFAVRGCIIDLFPSHLQLPLRIEYDDDLIESLRYYDPPTQKTLDPEETPSPLPRHTITIFPAKEKNPNSTILDYFSDVPIIFYDNLLSLEENYDYLRDAHAFQKGLSTFEEWSQATSKSSLIYSAHGFLRELCQETYFRKGPQVHFEWLNQKLIGWEWTNPFIQPIHYYDAIDAEHLSSVDRLLLSLPYGADPQLHLYLLGHNQEELSHYQNKLDSLDLHLPDKTSLTISPLNEGFVLPECHLALLPYRHLTGRSVISDNHYLMHSAHFSEQFFEFHPGDHVVHQQHGIGKYVGSEKRKNQLGLDTEYFIVEYSDNSRLCVPYTQAHLLSKYIGAEYSKPTLHTLGSTRWAKQCAKTHQAIASYAQKLLELYALRSSRKRTPYCKDSPLMQQFESEFGFKETPDQHLAILAVKNDLISGNVMDRLICGDVGYGKTEVAMRAAFKTVVDGQQQVALLVPTTVLAMQHYDNFKERMEPYGIRIGVLSRFVTAAQMRETIAALAEGKIDILIGTHKIVGDKVVFKNLGLLIIDEEQRFGVKVKEKLKSVQNEIHCLTLSATPIPRTLYLSLVGARDLSVIATPPFQRLPTKTIIAESQDSLIQSALLREMSRGGQAFVIHNRVETIDEVANRIAKLIPHATIAIAHGQMDSHQLDEIFHQFKQGNVQILVATILVGNGIDIPRANTLIVDRAELFGLSDLYQLRGRVGRWNRRAYAYFLTPPRRVLGSSVEKRLQALLKAGSYGGGMLIAREDLEQRGAGDILGTEQSGQIATIGFQLYCKMLKQQVEALQTGVQTSLTDTRLDFPFDARIPEEYIDETLLRQEFYRRLGDASTLEAIEEVGRELRDRFGPPPMPVEWLYASCKIKLAAQTRQITTLTIKQGFLFIEYAPSAKKTSKNPTSKFQFPIGKIDTPDQLCQRALHILSSQ